MTDSRAIAILTLRGIPVMIDADLARLYGVPTGAINQAVCRNLDRFPDNSRFQLTLPDKTKVITDYDHLQSLKFPKVLPHININSGDLAIFGKLAKSAKLRVEDEIGGRGINPPTNAYS